MKGDFSRGKWIAFVHPPIYDFTAYDLWLRPLGLYHIGGYIKENTNLKIFLFDYLDRDSPLSPPSKSKAYGTGKFYRERVDKPEIFHRVRRHFYRFGIPQKTMEAFMGSFPPPEAVFITSGMTYWYPGVREAAESVKRVWGDVPVFIGGTYATLLPEHASKFGEVVKGEVGCEVLKIIEEATGKNYSCGLHPLPLFELSQRTSSVMTTTRGCPFRCSFCASFILHPWRKKPRERVLAEMEKLAKLGVKDVAFYDDALLVDADRHFKPIFREVVREKIPLRFHLPNAIHVRFLDQEVAELFRRANFKTIRLSLESVDQVFLKEKTPKLSLEEFERAVLNLESAGFPRRSLIAYVIVGVPGQKPDTVMRTLDYLERMRVKPSLAYYSPVPATADFAELQKEGYFPPGHDPLLHNKLLFPYMDYSPINEGDFEKIRRRAFEIAQKLSL